MKKDALALGAILVLSILLVVAACAPLEEPVDEPTPTVTETIVETEEATKEVSGEITQEPPPTAEPTTEVIHEPTEQIQKEPVEILLWTTEGEADGGLEVVRSLTDEYASGHPNVSFEVISKDSETLREDVLTAGFDEGIPDLLWTVNDHAAPFVSSGVLMPIDGLFGLDEYVDSALEAVQLDAQTWGLPISSGGHVMLIYNKDLIEEPPETTDELIEIGQQLTSGDQYALVYDQTDPLWLVPWLGGFRGSVFAEDGTTPTLDTEEMVNTLQFLYDIRVETPIVPDDSNYEGAHLLFDRGRAAMIINGDWSLQDYSAKFGDRLGVARIPRVSATGEWPHPYISGTYLMFPIHLQGDQDRLDAVTDFAQFVTNVENQALLVTELNRLPARREAWDVPPVANDPVLRGSAAQMVVGRPAPTAGQMRCNWEAMRPEMQAVLTGNKGPEQAAADMQQAAEICIENLEGR